MVSALSVNLAIINLEGVLTGMFFALSAASISIIVIRCVKKLKARTLGPVGLLSVARELCTSLLFVSSVLFTIIVTAVMVMEHYSNVGLTDSSYSTGL